MSLVRPGLVLLVLGALLVVSRRPRAGAPVLALLALAGLLRPEAWAFSGLYWLYAIGWAPAFVRRRRGSGGPAPVAADPRRSRREIALLALLAAAGPLVWVLSDLAPHRGHLGARQRHRQRARVHPA
jgi:hypothetical protein